MQLVLSRYQTRELILLEYQQLIFEANESLGIETLSKIVNSGFDSLTKADVPGIAALKAIAKAGKGIDLKKVVKDSSNIFEKIKKAFLKIKKGWKLLKKEGISIKTLGKAIDWQTVTGFTFDRLMALIAFGSGPSGILIRWIVKLLGAKIGETIAKLIEKAQAAIAVADTAFMKLLKHRGGDSSILTFKPTKYDNMSDEEIKKKYGVNEMLITRKQLDKLILKELKYVS